MARSGEHLARVLHYDDQGRPGTVEIIYPNDEVRPKPGDRFLSFRPGRPKHWRPDPHRAVPTAG